MHLKDFPDNRIDILRMKVGESGASGAALLRRSRSDAFASFSDLQSGFKAEFPTLSEV